MHKLTYKLTALIFALIFTFSLAVSTFATNYPATQYRNTYLDTSAAYTELNTFRTGNEAWYRNPDNLTKTSLAGKLQPMKRDPALEQTARIRAGEIAQKFSHTRPNGTSCFTAYPDYKAVGENIAVGQTSAAEVTTDWKEANDPYSGQGHRRNMLSTKYNAVGIACYADSNGVLYWVQSFGQA